MSANLLENRRGAFQNFLADEKGAEYERNRCSAPLISLSCTGEKKEQVEAQVIQENTWTQPTQSMFGVVGKKYKIYSAKL
jgi:hypothetical protein